MVAAEAHPGVAAVLTFKDCQDIPWYEDSHLLDQTLRYHGEEVAVVAAEDEQTALDALALIDLLWPVILAVMSAFILIRLVKRGGSKI